ncbi:MAG: hypothetical protein R3D60_06215 [Paracoccaceae bacterium]
MLRALRSFLFGESGSTTADWIVLTSGVVGLGIGAIAMTHTGVVDLGMDVSTSLSGSVVDEPEETRPELLGSRQYSREEWFSYTIGDQTFNGMAYVDSTEESWQMPGGSVWTKTTSTYRDSGFWEEPVWRNERGQVVSAPDLGSA